MKTAAFIILLFAFPVFAVDTFTFSDDGKIIEGYFSLPETPKALILYFHRSVEDRNAVLEWSKLLNPAGYAVAGYTRTITKNILLQENAALQELRKRKGFAAIPLISMGASMGAPEAAKLFGSSPQIRALILLVPGSESICEDFSKANGRPIFLIYAEKDEIVDMGNSKKLVNCLPKKNCRSDLLAGQTHRFPPALVSPQIIEWLNSNISQKR